MTDAGARWAALVGHWPGYVFILDADNRITSLNRSTRLIDAERDLGRDLFDFVQADQRQTLLEWLTEARAGREAITRRYSAQLAEDTRRWYQSRLVALEGGSVLLLTDDVTDDEERKLALELAERRFGALVENNRDAMAEATRRASEGERSRQRLAVLDRATQAISDASRSPERLFDVAVRELADVLQCACALSLLSDDGTTFSTSHVHACQPALLTSFRAHLTQREPRSIAAHPGLKHVVETGTPFFVPTLDDRLASLGTGAGSDVMRFAHAAYVRSVIVVPLRIRGRTIGALGLTRHGDGPPPFDEQDLVLAQSLAAHASLALAAARLREASERELEERERMAARLRLLADASREFSEATGDYDRLLPVIARRMSETLGDFCAIRALRDDGTAFEDGAVHHADPEVVAWARDLLTEGQTVGEGAMGRVAMSRQPLFLRTLAAADYAATTSPRYREILERLAIGSVMVVPLFCRGSVVGALSLLRSGSAHPYEDADLQMAQSIADHAGLAIANARSYAAERAARAEAVHANEALHQSEVAHRLLFERSPVPLVVFDVETFELLAANDAMLRQYGYDLGEVLRLRVADLRADADTAVVQSNVAAMGNMEGRGLSRHRRKDGSQLFVEYTSRALMQGGRRACISVLQDVSARHDAEASRALLAAIVDSANDAIVSKRLDGTITSWNAAAERLFGYSAAEAVGQFITLIVPPEGLAEERTLFDHVRAGERVDQMETVRRRKDGTEVTVSISVAPILDGTGRVVGASKTVRDLTAQRQAERALRATEQQLRQSQKMDAVGRLAGGIAHDFNNMLSVILSYAEMLLAEVDPADPKRDDLGEIRAAALRAADLTRQLLMFSRQQVVSPKVLDLNDVLARMGSMLRRILGEDIDLVFVAAQDLGRVTADPSNVEQVIMNLVVNARDAMPTGGKLTIETANAELDADYSGAHLGAASGPYVMLAVSDTGSGMDRATQARIFEPFFTTKEVGRGTGLGLSTVFGIVQQSGGTVWVYSEPGAGAVFKVYLPRAVAAVDTASTPNARMDLRGTETVLLVEDQEAVRAVALTILQRSGYRVLVADSPSKAVALSAAHPDVIDLLLTDVVMPEMGGAELARRIALTRPETKVLCMSGYTDDSVVRHGVLQSEMPFLQKPFTPDALRSKLREVLDARSGNRPRS